MAQLSSCGCFRISWSVPSSQSAARRPSASNFEPALMMAESPKSVTCREKTHATPRPCACLTVSRRGNRLHADGLRVLLPKSRASSLVSLCREVLAHGAHQNIPTGEVCMDLGKEVIEAPHPGMLGFANKNSKHCKSHAVSSWAATTRARCRQSIPAAICAELL